MDPQKDSDSKVVFDNYQGSDNYKFFDKDISKSLDSLGFKFFLKQLINHYLVNRLANLIKVRWFALVWLLFISIISVGLILQIRSLTSHYTTLVADSGGTYTEGIAGKVTNFNPLYATTEADQTVANLVFAPLFRYDNHNNLQPVLADKIESDEKAQQFTLHLKPNLNWHDGEDITIDDVIFTINTIKDYRSQSPLRANWQDVEVDKLDDLSLVFTLPASFSPFVANLNLAIVPEHILSQHQPSELRNISFNYQPIGSGAFKFAKLVNLPASESNQREVRIELVKNNDYQAISDQLVLIDNFHIWVASSSTRITELFNQGLIDGSLDIDPQLLRLNSEDYREVNFKLSSGVYLLFNNSSFFFKEESARRAVVTALNSADLLASLPSTSERILGPLLPEHLGYDASLRPPPYNPSYASNLLNGLDYTKDTNDKWVKGSQPLRLTLTVVDDTDYELIASSIKQQLEAFGIEVIVNTKLADNISLEVLQNHNYGDMIIYGFNLGRDADVYSFWHSSQIGSQSIFRLNLAEYRSELADQALEVGRSRWDKALRAEKYYDFQSIWMADLPALALYRPKLSYYMLSDIRGIDEDLLLTKVSDRFNNIEDWAVKFKTTPN